MIESGHGVVVTKLADHLRSVEEARRRSSSPRVSQLFGAVTQSLASCGDYRGSIRVDFDELLITSLRFLEARYDITQGHSSKRLGYLFENADQKTPLEGQLADDYQDWIWGNGHWRAKPEVSDIGAGRVDLLVDCTEHRFPVELKRESSDVSEAGLATYLSQAAIYQQLDVPLGLLVVLDLTPKPGGARHWRGSTFVSVIPPRAERDIARHVVVLLVPARKPRPSEATAS